MTTRVLLVRHAQSTWNAAGRWQGWADPPLSPAGQLAARAAADDPVLETVTAVATSDLLRARGTAAAVAEARGLGPVHVVRGLRERGAGRWTGLTRPEIDAGWPGRLGERHADIPDGESPAAVAARGIAALHRVAAAFPGTDVLAVSHGALIRLVEDQVGGDPVHVPNLAGRWVEVSGGRVVLGPVVILGAFRAEPAA